MIDWSVDLSSWLSSQSHVLRPLSLVLKCMLTYITVILDWSAKNTIISKIFYSPDMDDIGGYFICFRTLVWVYTNILRPFKSLHILSSLYKCRRAKTQRSEHWVIILKILLQLVTFIGSAVLTRFSSLLIFWAFWCLLFMLEYFRLIPTAVKCSMWHTVILAIKNCL